eukprot:gene4792-5419_t
MGFSMYGRHRIKCKRSGKWDLNPPKCQDFGKCGESGIISKARILGGTRSKIGSEWPWQVAIFSNYPHLQHFKFRCGGSLIRDQIVLTAAHCFNNAARNGVHSSASSYRVIVGELKLHPDEMKPGDIWFDKKAKRIKKINVHPRYNPAEMTPKNDIALVELVTAVKSSPKVRPVCLPTKAHSLRAKMPGYVSGWGNTANVAKGKWHETSLDLRYVSLPVQSNTVCGLRKRRKLKMFCAGDGLGKKDACQGDSGGPFVVNQPDDESQTKFSFKIMGIVSWGPRCGTVGHYGYYTRVTNYLDWIDKTIEKNEKKCGADPDIDNGRYIGSSTKLGAVKTAVCDTGYDLVGNPSITCGTNGWIFNYIKPTCKEKKCGADPDIDNGRYIGSSTKLGAVKTAVCDTGYNLVGNPSITCGTNGWIFNYIKPTCKDYNKCGEGGITPRGRILGGTRSRIGSEWPWQVAIYRYDPANGHYMFHCGGSLIRNNIVLTAAHCFINAAHNGLQTKTNSYRVIVGELKLHPDGTNDGDKWILKEGKRIKKIHVHEKYDGYMIPKNDIALVELVTAVKWSPKVRPVCLPTKSHSLRANIYGYVSGWGNTANVAKGERLEKPLDLRYVSLPVQSNKTCGLEDERNLIMFCAGDGLGERSDCRGDGGGPFVVNQPDDESQTKFSFKIMGIVSSGPPCGTVGDYGYYTRVTNYLDWIDNTIKLIKKER